MSSSIVSFPIPFDFFFDGLFDCSCHSACLARSQNDGLEFKSSIYFFLVQSPRMSQGATTNRLGLPLYTQQLYGSMQRDLRTLKKSRIT